MAEDLGERSEDPTPKRRREAREEGNVAKSQDFTAAVLLLIATLLLWMGTEPMLKHGANMLMATLDRDTLGDPLKTVDAGQVATFVGGVALLAAGPILLVIWIGAIVTQVGQIGLLFAPSVLSLKLDKLNPISGFQRLFSMQSVVKVGIDIAKIALVLTVAIQACWSWAPRIINLSYLALGPAVMEIGSLAFDLAMRILALLLVLGLIDLVYQKRKYTQKMKMTKHQVKEEMKQSEGDPEVKRRRYRMMQQIMAQRIKAAVPKADVVVTNPEHYSVAIQYESGSMNAPRVIAKGVDFLALRIRQVAIASGVPIIQRPPLARALYKHVAVNQEISPEYYKAVAEILAYVYRLSGRKAG